MRTLLVYTYLNNPNAYPPLGIVHLGTEMRNVGAEVELYDMTWDKTLQPVKDKIREVCPSVVGLSTLSITYETSVQVGRIAKSYGSHVVIGGAHACTGEPVDGTMEIHDGPYFFDPTLVPDRTMLPTMSRYLAVNPGFPYLMPWTHLIASRGCPFDCSFCQPMLRKLWGRRTIHRSVSSVAEEIDGLLRSYDLSSFTFMDDTMISNAEWLEEMCGELKKFKTPWTCQTNIRTVTWDKLKMMKEAGCYFIGMGVESGSEWINKHVYNKPQTKKQIRKAFEMCEALDILTEATLIIGAPEDTEETINETARLMREVSPDVVDLHILAATPGSTLCAEYRQRGLLDDSDGRVYDRYTVGQLHSESQGRLIKRWYWVVIRSWLEGKSLWRTNRYWYKWWRSLQGLWAKTVGIVRWLIYHSYFWHRVLKEGVWTYRRILRTIVGQ